MSSTGLAVSGVDFRISQNAQAHLTNRYELVHLSDPGVVLRRGQHFTIQVNIRNGPFNPRLHRLTLVFDFKTAGDPNPFHGTRGEARLNGNPVFGWSATQKESSANHLVIQVQSPSTAPVGEWTVKVVTSSQQGQQNEYRYPGSFYLLFHPWHSADQVHMPERQLLDEYVYNDVGKLYQKKDEGVWGQHWIYGQFDKTAMYAAMRALELSGLEPRQRGNPVLVSRAVTYMANSSLNPNGILVGLWPEGDFPQPSTRPWEWTSSVQILEEYVRNREPVKYGQCWVFGAIVTTVCRTLGIPVRTVTTIDSAHDGDHDLALSKFYDENGEKTMHPVYGSGEDQQWSFHVWNEAWMARPDLARGYGGWQAIDGTPQDQSEDKYQCGPAPVEAIKKGEVGMSYDVGAFIAATNADLIHWKKTDGQYKITKVERERYGTAIYTKKPYTFDPNGETDREDIKDLYKFSEGSQSERIFLMNAVRQIPRARVIYNVRRESWRDDLDIGVASVPIVPLGQDLVIPLRVKNKSGANCRVSASITAVSMYYNGMKGRQLRKIEGITTFRPGQEEMMYLRLGQRDYVGKLVEHGSVHAYAAVSVVDTNQTWIEEVETGFRVPKIIFEPLQNVRVGHRSTLTLNLRNPMNVALTGCKFLFFAPGITVAREMPHRNINPGEHIRTAIYIQPAKEGLHTLTATFMCRETMNFIGRVNIQA